MSSAPLPGSRGPTAGRGGMRVGAASGVLLAALIAAAPGCSRRDTVAADAGRCDPAVATVLADGRCTGALAQRFFGRAVCACGRLSLPSDLVTDGFDSRVAPYAPGGAGGDVGANGGLASDGALTVGGSLVVSGGGVDAGPTLTVAGDLDAGGALARPASTVTIGGSARVAGNVGVTSLTLTGAGTLTVPPGATVTGFSGTPITADVSVAPPCDCDAAQGVRVAEVVAQYASLNDDASIGLASDALSFVSTTVAPIALPCGHFYLDRIQGAGDVTLRATGRTALFVGSGITLAGALTIELDPLAELDLFVDGSVNLPGTLRLGDPARPAALRIWLASPGAISLPAGTQWAATLYAPATDLATAAPLDLYGAVLVAHVLNGAPLSVHHDRAVTAAAEACRR